MGFWGDLLGIGGDIAGAAVGMPWLGSAATAVGNAITGSQAASSAAATQQAAAQQAAALQQPAMQVGSGALAKLAGLYGLGPVGIPVLWLAVCSAVYCALKVSKW